MVLTKLAYPLPLLGLLGLCFLPGQIMLAQPTKSIIAANSPAAATEVSAIAEQITVRINGQNPGSGVLIKKSGQIYTVLTAAHVVATEDEYEVITHDENQYPLSYQRVLKFPEVDLALVEFESNKSYRVADLGDSDTVRSGASVFVSGFPMPTSAITNSIWTFSPGSVTAHARRRALADGYALVYTNNTLPGMSGGAVLDSQGRLIGIHGRADTEQLTQKTETVYVKTGFNLGIPIQTFLTLAPQVSPNLGLGPSTFNVASSSTTKEPTSVLAADDWYLSAAQNFKQGNYQGAIADLDQTLKLKPDFTTAYFVRGLARKRNGDLQRAATDYTRAIQLNPKYVKAFNNRANVRQQLGDHTGAMQDYNQAILLQPDHASAYRNRGLVKARLGDSNGAIADYSKAIQFKPDYAEAYLNRGYERSTLDDFKEAIQDYSKAIKLKPDYAEAYGNRSIMRATLGDRQGALQDARAAARLFQEQARPSDYRKALGLIDELSQSSLPQ